VRNNLPVLKLECLLPVSTVGLDVLLSGVEGMATGVFVFDVLSNSIFVESIPLWDLYIWLGK
jgi:hypothetical protein